MTEDKIKILLVDDEQEVIAPICSYFRRRKYEVLSASSAKQTLSLMKAESPHIMILDINLPDENTIYLLKAVRQLTPVIKIIVISGQGLDADMAGEFKDLEIFKFIVKPVMFTELEEAVVKAIKPIGGKGNGLA